MRVTRVKWLLGPEGEHDYAFAPMSVTVTLEDEMDHPDQHRLAGRAYGAVESGCRRARNASVVAWDSRRAT